MNEVIAIPGFEVNYDRASDVLYVTRRPGAPARSREGAPGLVWRHDLANGDLIGLTVIDFVHYWGARRSELAGEIAERFAISRSEATALIAGVEATAEPR